MNNIWYKIDNEYIPKDVFMLKLKMALLLDGYEHHEHQRIVNDIEFNRDYKFNKRIFKVEKE